ncbi:hypothetical protein GX48_08211 [Paracoccidioides brasiliensis]|nr:hypothetical protein GX48_08211 [Paracoccidioides brasiliensis]
MNLAGQTDPSPVPQHSPPRCRSRQTLPPVNYPLPSLDVLPPGPANMPPKRKLRETAAAPAEAKKARPEEMTRHDAVVKSSPAPEAEAVAVTPPAPTPRAPYTPALKDSAARPSRCHSSYLSEEELDPRLVASRSPVRRTQPCEALGTQGPTVSTPSLTGAMAKGIVGEQPARQLAGTSCCLRCAKQLKNGGIFCSRSSLNSRCFRCAKNNDSCLPVPMQYRARLSSLQVLADSVSIGEVPLAQLQKEAHKWVSDVEKHLRVTMPKKKGVVGAARSTTETVQLLEKISLQMEQMTQILCQMAGVPVPPVPVAEVEFGGGEVVEK